MIPSVELTIDNLLPVQLPNMFYSCVCDICVNIWRGVDYL